MRKIHFQQVIILSAELSTLDKHENDKRTENLKQCLSDLGLGHTRALGKYKDEYETSFIVLVNNDSEIEAVKDLAFKSFNQESILYQDRKGGAYMRFNNTLVTNYLGKLRKITMNQAYKRDGFTMLNGEYYGIVS